MAGVRLILILLGFLLTVKTLHSADPTSHAKKLRTLTLLKNVQKAKKLVSAAYKRTRESFNDKLRQDTLSPGDVLVSAKQPVGQTRMAVRAADCMHVALALLKEKLQKKIPWNFNITDLLTSAQLRTIYKATGCGQQEEMTVQCNAASPYRTITGECNNLRIPTLGASNRPYARWLPQEYEDGISLPRGWTETKRYFGFPLPLVRKVSNEIVRFPNDKVTNDTGRSVMFMQWGQFLDHDMDFGPSSTTTLTFMSKINCGTSCAKELPCFPIKIPPDDPRIKNQSDCIPFTRSAPACNGGYAIRNQINALTAFIDASMVYASEERWANQLRNLSCNLGLLNVNQNFTDKGQAYLPFGNPDGFTELCNRTNPKLKIPCFFAGDNRVSEMPALTVLQTIFFREHNRVATELKRLNPLYNGEQLYQEARKIIGAMMQKITYTEYLPRLLGNRLTRAYGWAPYRGYNDSVDPRIASIFTIMFRFGHSQVRNLVFRVNSSYQLESQTPLNQEFFASWRIIRNGGIDPIMRGLLVTPAKLLKPGEMVVDALRDRLFEQVLRIGLDLPALNMQRGRDFGLPGYNAWRRFCGLSQPRNEAELGRVLQNPQLARKFIQLYGTPDNIDIWIGGLAEPLVPSGRVGPLMACILQIQFRKLRDGDRFWWENPGVFTSAQRAAISKVSFSRLICDNTSIRKVPRSIFSVSRFPRDFVDCSSVPRFSLFPWKTK